jgi:peptidoglycan/xylan/chitin deacetylase (PgdA/CDA1 family)
MLLAVLLAILVLVCWFLVPFVWRKVEERRLARLCRDDRTIVLTYDDGPGPRLTPQLLELLKGHDVPASFFPLGRNATKQPGLVKHILENGHEAGSHTQNHSNAWKSSPLIAAKDLAEGIETVGSLGADRGLFRPPYGKLTLAGLIDGAQRGLRYAWWTVDSRDSWAQRPIDDVIAEIKARGGGVVLMHDFDEYTSDRPGMGHIDYVLTLTRSIIEFAHANGYRLMRLGDLMKSVPLSGVEERL